MHTGWCSIQIKLFLFIQKWSSQRARKTRKNNTFKWGLVARISFYIRQNDWMVMKSHRRKTNVEINSIYVVCHSVYKWKRMKKIAFFCIHTVKNTDETTENHTWNWKKTYTRVDENSLKHIGQLLPKEMHELVDLPVARTFEGCWMF